MNSTSILIKLKPVYPNLVSVFVFSPVTAIQEIQVIVPTSTMIRLCFSPSFIHPFSKSLGLSAGLRRAAGRWPRPQGAAVSAPRLGRHILHH